MKAAQISEYGSADVIRLNDIDRPPLGADQVLVEVRAASLNPFDAKIRAGHMQQMIPLRFPVTLGGDIAGVVVETGMDVAGIRAGDAVYGGANAVGGASGAFAEFAVTKAAQLAKMPANTDYKQAAALPLVGVSALQALTDHMRLQAGQRILIHGGAGGIGAVAIQLAKHIGAYVATTVTADSAAFAAQLGADEVIDYQSVKFEEQLEGMDAVFDMVGGETFRRSFKVVKRGGIIVSMVGGANTPLAGQYGVRVISQQTRITTEALDKLRELVESGAVKAHIGREYPLDQIAEAFRAFESGTVGGKVVIVIKP